MFFANQPYSFSSLLGAIFKAYFPLIKKVGYLFIAIIFTSYLVMLLINSNFYVGLAVGVLGFLVIVFFLAMAVNLANAYLSNQPLSFVGAYTASKRRYLTILGGVVLLLIVHALAQAAIYGLLQLGSMLDIPHLFQILSFILGFFVLVVFYLVLPQLVLGRDAMLDVYGSSVVLAFKNFWHLLGVIFVIYLLFVLIFISGLLVFRLEQLGALLSWLLLLELIFYPLFIASMLFLLHDSKLHVQFKK